MTEFFSEEIQMQNRRSSKGNQLKFERNHVWYKADYLGYEGLVEYVVSKLLRYSSLQGLEYVDYELEQITYNGQVFNACKSQDFTGGWQLITLERLLTQVFGRGLNQVVYAIEDHTERLKKLTELVEQVTGIRDFGMYMAKLITIDTFFLNEDRHAHNLAVLTKDLKEFRLCPVFDNGAALLSDTMLDYPEGRDPLQMKHQTKRKTFCDSFDEQLETAEALYGMQMRFQFRYNEVKAILDQADIYTAEIRKRVLDLVMSQKSQYQYLFT
jgi:hypothetical protein